MMLTLADLYIDRGIPVECSLLDRRRVTIMRQLYGTALLGVSAKYPSHDDGTFNSQWDYPSVEAAQLGLQNWNPAEHPEPTGWHRHHMTGRYRIDGRSDMEYVRSDKSIEEQVRHAVHVTQPEDRMIAEVSEDANFLDEIFPRGTRHFRVVVESTSVHDTREVCFVYHYIDRCVVLNQHDIEVVSVGTLTQRLKGGK